MKTLTLVGIDQEKVRERIDSYLINKGYRIERMITSERFGIFTPNDLLAGKFAQPALVFSVGMAENETLKELFAPIGRIYAQGRKFFTEASVLTPIYTQLSKEYEQQMQNLQGGYLDVAQEVSEKLSKSGIFGRWSLSRRSKRLKEFYQRIQAHVSSHLPKPVPREASISALNRLYDWLQIGEEDLDSRRATDELAHPFNLLTEEKIRLLKIESDLYKIKNHTAIVCLDQLKQHGLTLDAVVSKELDRIPWEYMVDVSSYGKLRIGSSDSFGAGLFN